VLLCRYGPRRLNGAVTSAATAASQNTLEKHARNNLKPLSSTPPIVCGAVACWYIGPSPWYTGGARHRRSGHRPRSRPDRKIDKSPRAAKNNFPDSGLLLYRADARGRARTSSVPRLELRHPNQIGDAVVFAALREQRGYLTAMVGLVIEEVRDADPEVVLE